MIVDHIGIYTDRLEVMKSYYSKYYEAVPSKMYFNEKKQFRSYFISFHSGARIEIMSMPGIPDNANDTRKSQYKGFIHLGIAVETMQDVDSKARQLEADGYEILDGPRKTGDGYYEFVTLDPDGNRIEVTTKFMDFSG
jgi:lactoylglutathione lyase